MYKIIFISRHINVFHFLYFCLFGQHIRMYDPHLGSCEIIIIAPHVISGIRIVLSSTGISFKRISLTVQKSEKLKCEFSVPEVPPSLKGQVEIIRKCQGRLSVVIIYSAISLTLINILFLSPFPVLAENTCSHLKYSHFLASMTWLINIYTR